MTTYTIKENQNALDVSNNIYTNQDSIYKLYIDNLDFDINEMQHKLSIEYTKPTNNQIYNDIINNNYTFKNNNVKIFKNTISMIIGKGIFDMSIDAKVYNPNGSYYPNYKIHNVDTKESIVNNVVSGDTFYQSYYELQNNVTIEMDSSTEDVNVYSYLDFNDIDIIMLSFDNIKVGDNFKLYYNNKNTTFEFLNQMIYTNIGNTIDITTIDVSYSLSSTTLMESFCENLLSSSLSTPITSGKVIISSGDIVPLGTNWDTLVANGWSVTII